MDETIRLNKYLSEAGVCSRREADRLIAAGKVTVEGQVASTGMKVAADALVCVEGEAVRPVRQEILLAVNKPRGVVCTTEKKWGDQTLEELVHYPQRVFCVGRLDKESEGLILMTNQGALADRILRARNGHEKEYEVRTDRPVQEEDLAALARGIYLEELQVTTRPCRVTRMGRDGFRIVLTQGLNRQIRRMCSARGLRVVHLRRVRVMNVLLGDLPVGAWRELTGEERSGLKAMLTGEMPERQSARAGGKG